MKLNSELLLLLAALAGLLFTLTSCDTNPKLAQYKVAGETLYVKHCSNCHQKTGIGLGLVYPPLDKSDYVDNNASKVVCLIRYGLEGPITVNGMEFNKSMPGIPQLTDLEIAEITTYLYNSWGREKGIIETDSVGKVLNLCDQ